LNEKILTFDLILPRVIPNIFDQSYGDLRLAYGIGAGYSTIRHARMFAEVYDSDLVAPLDGISGSIRVISTKMEIPSVETIKYIKTSLPSQIPKYI